MTLEHIMPDRYYSIQELFKISQKEFFGFGLKSFSKAIRLGTDGIKCPYYRAGEKNHAYRVKGADFLQFQKTIALNYKNVIR